MLFLTTSFSSCYQQEEPNKEEEKSPCDRQSLMSQYPWSAGTPPWVFEMMGEWLENRICGSIIECDYKDGWGYKIEPHEVNDDFGYSFLNCEGEVLYEGKNNPEVARPDLNIKGRFLLISIYPSWDSDQDGTSDEFPCYAINPFTLPLVKEMLYSCNFYSCEKIVSLCTYRDGIGFLLGNHTNAGYNDIWDFLDCNGNLLCNITKVGDFSYNWCPELNIDFANGKIILRLKVSLSFH